MSPLPSDIPLGALALHVETHNVDVDACLAVYKKRVLQKALERVEKDSEKESVMDTVWLTREQRSQLQS